MKKLIEALTIFLKYRDEVYPTHCEHDVLCVVGIAEDAISEEDQKKLDELGGWFWNTEYDCWASYEFGSA